MCCNSTASWSSDMFVAVLYVELLAAGNRSVGPVCCKLAIFVVTVFIIMFGCKNFHHKTFSTANN